jgi:SAM-dependent methyltransferase
MEKIEAVEAFWSANPCESDLARASDRRQYFEQIERIRYSHHAYIPPLVHFEAFAAKRVLEIGCGIGTDGRRFAKAGAIYTGVNLDEGSTQLARESFALFGLPGTIVKMNAESLGFADSSFDHVYSMGVIHHSPNPQRILREAFRVLAPGGTLRIMVYHRSSINYHVNIMLLRRGFRYLLVPRSAPRVISRVTGLSESKLARHRHILLTERMDKERWISINTDGPDCPLSRVYTRAEGVELVRRAGFRDVSSCIRFFDRRHYGFLGRLIPTAVGEALGRRWGWHLWLEAVKPGAARDAGAGGASEALQER